MAPLLGLAYVASAIGAVKLLAWASRTFNNATDSEAWLAMGELLSYSGITGRLIGKLDDLVVRVDQKGANYRISVNLQAEGLGDWELMKRENDPSDERVATGDPIFDRRFTAVGDTAAIFATLGLDARVQLIRLGGEVTVSRGMLQSRVSVGASAKDIVAHIHSLVHAAKALIVADLEAALVQNMLTDPSDDVRLGAFSAALRIHGVRRKAIEQASASTWPDLRLKASDIAQGKQAAKLLASVIKSAPSSLRCEALRRANERADVKIDTLVATALATQNMAVMEVLRELEVDVSGHLELIRREIEASPINPEKLVLLFIEHAVADDCAMLLQKLERYPSNVAAVAPLLGRHGGALEAQSLRALAAAPDTTGDDRRALLDAAERITDRAAAQGGAGRLSIAQPIGAGRVAVASEDVDDAIEIAATPVVLSEADRPDSS